ncbi:MULTISPECIES: 3-hydroxyacyl-CoA dehydrogenase [unclassified Streptomyces]|uniref:3-hydroxyacyl-CoA dehydrogenase n=1 Tax=unclassified Streptomyces TaxID=2593676 RepID=UPI0022B6AE8C|nr:MULTISPECIES: 3-hydroxyacyl-CoA dehydrogenase [unclassified Streptomyces]MCZ7413189.1 3-hydroxyacyl-CoA dehydrogenase [Streptomyces sp. WMMC897]MCZ7417777.1 3-hydroxyacyl-CoA dehydrogenase [Streptomyces sp. WMMC897]MCZ7432427.1 3-hydroxyacyl-CoA dehydrogenase [Streptomyces sp. WMMC1477]
MASEDKAPQTARSDGAFGTVAVVGTGTMGQGIAQVALVAGHRVRLHDVAPGRAEQAAAAITGRLDRLVEKGRMTAGAREAAVSRLHAAAELGELADAEIVIEAVLEELGAKQLLFEALESVVGGDCLLATNTSSLSVTAIAGALRRPGRFLGLHFFNPAPLLPLVEVVSGHATDEAAAVRARDLAAAWGKTPVRCTDTPGFIVNRVARPFYAESFRLLEERAAAPATLDAVLRESGGFRMGPFELTDLIGQDVNEAVTRSVWSSFFQDPKFTPSLAQQRLVQSGRLGRKSGHGWFPHGDGAAGAEPHTMPPHPAPRQVTVHGSLGPAAVLPALLEKAGIGVVRTEAGEAEPGSAGHLVLPGGSKLCPANGHAPAPGEIHLDLALDYRTAERVALGCADDVPETDRAAAAGLFQALGKRVSLVEPVPGLVVARTVAMLADFAADAVARGVATEADVDTAMRLGVNYPRGPLEWCDALGSGWAVGVLRALHAAYPTGRYAPSQGLLRRCGPIGGQS